MKKRKRTTILLFLILFAGLSLLLYPTVSDYWNSLHQSRVIAGYTGQLAALPQADRQRLWADAQAYNQALQEKSNPFFLTQAEQTAYAGLLDAAQNGVMGYLEIPSLDCRLPIYHGTDEAVLQVGVGHLEGSSLPVGGPGTHCVLSGHRGLPSARLFTDLDRLQPGDGFTLHVLEETLSYEVDQIRIVEPQQLEELAIQPGEDYCTLVTCTPYGINTHRLLVRGRRVSDRPQAAQAHLTADAVALDPAAAAPLAAVPLGLLLLAAAALQAHRKKQRGERTC